MKVDIVLTAVHHVDALYALIDEDRAHLANLIWAKGATRESTHHYLAMTAFDPNQSLHTIYADGNIAGVIVQRRNVNHSQAELGYWVGKRYSNKGVATAAVGLATMMPIVPLTARVRVGNTHSISVLTKNFFREVSDDGEWKTFRKSRRGD